MFLIPRPGVTDTGYHDPYTESGARSIIRRFQDDVKDMLRHMLDIEAEYSEGRVMLARSPLRKKVWVAGAMKTLDLIEEHNTKSGACALTLKKRGRGLSERLGLNTGERNG